MADWIHCNKCFVRYKQDVKFNFMQCYHIICDKCCGKAEPGTCPVCTKKVAVVALTKDLSDRIKSFFLPIEESTNYHAELVKFQTSQMINLIRHLQTKYASAKSEVLRFYKLAIRLKQENEKLQYKHSNSLFPCGSGSFGTSTPASGSIRSNTFMLGSAMRCDDHTLTPINPSNSGNRYNPYVTEQQWPGKAQRLKPPEINQVDMKMYDSGGLSYSSKRRHGGPVPVHMDGNFQPHRDRFKPLGTNNQN